MRRDRGEASCCARYAVLESSPSPVVWAELDEATCDVSNSVLLNMLGKFVLEFFFFESAGLSASTGFFLALFSSTIPSVGGGNYPE